MERIKSSYTYSKDLLGRGWDKLSFGLNFDWVALKRIPAATLFCALTIILALVVGLTAVPVKNGVTLGVEFGGGYELRYNCTQKPGGVPVTEQTVSSQANSMYTDCVNNGHTNCVVQYFLPSSINVIIPGVSTASEIEPVLTAFGNEPLALDLKFSISVSGVLGADDLKHTVKAAAIAFGVVWAVLLLRYLMAGVIGLFLTIVFLWLLIIFFNASPSVISEAAIVAFVLNIGLAADAHIITFERAREELHALPYGASPAEGLAALQTALKTSFITILEANVTTVIAMLVLFIAGVGPVQDFAFMVLISVGTSVLINVILARLLLRLGWNAGFIRTGMFFGDKGPAYDEEESKKWYSTNKYWRPRRSFPINYIFFWWVGVLASLAVIIAGCVYLGNQTQHPLNLDIDFTQGTALDLTFPPGTNFTAAGVAAIAEDTSGKSVATFAAGNGALGKQVAVRFDDVLTSQSVQKIVKTLDKQYHTNVTFEENTVDPTVAITTVHHGIIAIIVSAVLVTVFVLLRFGFFFAVAGFVALASSGIFSLSCFALGGFEIDVTFVAAVLTVFSYTINDCVVVFDRIRYEKKAAGDMANTPEGMKKIVNGALSRVCIRSLLTLAMVIVCSLCMVFMGAEPLRAFSLAITFGLLSATYTTLLIVSPLYYGLVVLSMTSCCAKRSARNKEKQALGGLENEDASMQSEKSGMPQGDLEAPVAQELTHASSSKLET